MERIGEVVSVSGDELLVTFCRPTDCEKCGACHGGRSQMELKIKGKAEKGDQVVVDMPTGNVLKASALAYMVPLVGLLGGMIAGYFTLGSLMDRNLATIIGGGIGLPLGLLIIRMTDGVIKNNVQWQPQLVRVISARQEEK